MDLVFRAIIVSFTTPAAVELSVCIGVGGCGYSISIRIWHIGTSSFDLMNMAPSSASSANDMKNVRIGKYLIWVHYILVLVHLPPGRRGILLGFGPWIPYGIQLLSVRQAPFLDMYTIPLLG